MRRWQSSILTMCVLSRSIFVCVLALLQLSSGTGHVLHYTLEGAVPERRDCTDATCRMDQNSAASRHDEFDTDPPVQHDCNNCFLCDASDGQIARVTRQQRPIEYAVTVSPLSGLAAFESLANPMLGLPPVSSPLHPATLHAVTLPLLD